MRLYHGIQYVVKSPKAYEQLRNLPEFRRQVSYDILAEIGHVPDDDQDLCREFLFDNLYGDRTKGSVFAASRWRPTSLEFHDF